MRCLLLSATIVIALLTVRTTQVVADPSAAPGVPTQPGMPPLQPATFEGVIPCADCPGIKLTIDLKKDGSYTLHRVYLERSTSSEEHGTWSYDRQRSLLTLTPVKGARERFRVTFVSALHMLDANDKPLPPSVPSTLTEVGESVATLAGSGWTLLELGGKPVVRDEQHPVTMVFDENGDRVAGSGGCNHYTGPYAQDGDRLTFGVLAATRMMCENISGEDAFFAMLANVASFVRTGEKQNEKLTLYDKDGKALAKLGYEK